MSLALLVLAGLAGVVDLGPVTTVDTIVLDGDQVYWTERHDQDARVRRASRAGGAAQELAVVPELGPGGPSLAIVRGAVFVTSLDRDALRRPGPPQAVVRRLEGGRGVPFAQHLGLGSSNLVAIDDALYWSASSSFGPGPLISTRLSDSRTRKLLRCPDVESDCAQLLPGTPHLGALRRRVYRLAGGRARLLPVRCPARYDPAVGLHDHLVCTPELTGDDGPALPVVAVPLRGGAAIEIEPLGEQPRWLGGHVYHVTPAGLVRRRGVTGTDEVLVAGELAAHAVSADGLAWVTRDHLWTAPLPP